MNEMEVKEVMKRFEVIEVNEVSEVSDNSSAADNAVDVASNGNVDRSTSGRLQGKNSERSDNFGNFDNFANFANFANFDNSDNYKNKEVMANSKSFREVRAWQKAHEFVLAFYKTKKMFPDDEKFALIPQFQRAAVSIAANIAEGYKKLSKADKLRFMNIAQGSLEECRYYIILSHDVGYYSKDVANDMWTKIEAASTVLNAYCKAIKDNKGITDEV